MRLTPGARIAHLTPARPFFCREVELNPVIFRKGPEFWSIILRAIYFTILQGGTSGQPEC